MTKQRAMKEDAKLDPDVAKLDPDCSKTLQSVRLNEVVLIVGNPSLYIVQQPVRVGIYTPFITKHMPNTTRSASVLLHIDKVRKM